MTLKTCSRCRGAKTPDQYGRDSSRPDGLTSCCKACRSEVGRAKRAADARPVAPVVELPGLRLVDTMVEPILPASAPASREASGPAAPRNPAREDGRHTCALRDAIAAADWLGPLDAPVIEYALSLARSIDFADDLVPPELADMVAPSVATPQYLMTLKALRLTPDVRMRDAAPAKPAGLNVANY